MTGTGPGVGRFGWRAMVVLLGSGASTLVLVAALHVTLLPLVGAGAASRSTLVACFLAAVAAGMLLTGHRPNRFSSPLTLAGLEMAKAIWGLGVVLFVPALLNLLAGIGPVASLSVSAWARRLLAVLLVFPFGTLAGLGLRGTLILLSGSPGKRSDLTELVGGTLLTGAAAGVVFAGYLFLPWKGTGPAAWFGFALALLAAAGWSFWAIREKQSEGAVISSDGVRRGEWMVALVSGFVIGAVTPVTGRLLGLLFGPTWRTSLTAALVILLGLSVGWIWSGLSANGIGSSQRLFLAFLAVGAGLLGALFLLEPLAGILAPTFQWSDSIFPLVRLCYSAALLFLIAAGCGGVLDLALRISLSRGIPAGKIPLLPGLGIGGASAGLLLFSWIGLPLLGGRTSLLVLLALVLAVAGFLQQSGSGWNRGWRTRLWILLPVVMFLGGLLSPAWSPGVLTSGIYRYPAMISARFPSGGDFLKFRRAASPIFFHHGTSGTIAVERGTDPGREGLFLTVDGTVEENWSTRILGYALTGHIAMLLRPVMPIEPSVALLGMGAGVTARSILLHDPASLTVIEPEPKVLEALQEFTDLSGPLLDSPRIEIVRADPRNFWILSSPEFDVVVSRGPEPWLIRGGPMYTREFFRQCRKHLTPAGIQVHRLPLTGLSEGSLKGILKGFLQAYPEAVAFAMTDRDILLIGSSTPLRFSLAAIQDRIHAPNVIADLNTIGVPGQNSILGRFLAGHEDLDLFTEDTPPFTNRMLPTRDLPRNLPTRETRDLMSRLDGVGRRILPFLIGFEEREKEGQALYGLAKTLILRGANHLAEDIAEEIGRLGFGERAGWLHGQLALQNGDKDRAFALWESVLKSDPDHLDSLMSLGGYFQDFSLYNAAEPYLARLEVAYPKKPLAQFYHGKNLYYLLKDGAAELALQKVIEMKGTDLYPSSLYFLGMIAKRNARTGEAIDYLSLYLKRAYGSGQLSLLEASTHQTLAELYRRLDQTDRAEQEEEMGRRLTDTILQTGGDGTDD